MAFAVRSAAAGKRRVAVSVASSAVIMLAVLMLVLPWQGAAPWAQGRSVGILRGSCPLQLCPPCAEGAAAQTSAAAGLPEEGQQQQAQEGQRDSDAAGQQGDGEQPAADPNAADGAPAPPPAEDVLCGGPAAIPQPPVALAAAGQALQRSLDAAFARWNDTGFSVEDLMATADELNIDGTHDTHVWVEVRNKTITFPRRHGGKCVWFCNNWLGPQIAAFNAALASGRLVLPEGLVMLWNVFDHSSCLVDENGRSRCAAPLLSVIRKVAHDDVLVPAFHLDFRAPYEPWFLPWEEKKDLAFFRGTPFCAQHPLNGTLWLPNSNCSREQLPLLSADHPEWLNVSLLHDHGRAKGLPGPLTSHEEHATYKYLLNLDGITASSRIAYLLSTNSLVLKQASEHLQWFYAALQPCVHYLEFWRDSETDVLPLLRTLRGSAANQAVAQRIAANAAAFAAAHLSEAGFWAYWQEVLDRYVRLYRGVTGGEATLAALRNAERKGRHASKVGEETEASCIRDGKPDCWAVKTKAVREALAQWDKQHPRGGQAGTPADGEQPAAASDAGGGEQGGGDGEAQPEKKAEEQEDKPQQAEQEPAKKEEKQGDKQEPGKKKGKQDDKQQKDDKQPAAR